MLFSYIESLTMFHIQIVLPAQMKVSTILFGLSASSIPCAWGATWYCVFNPGKNDQDKAKWNVIARSVDLTTKEISGIADVVYVVEDWQPILETMRNSLLGICLKNNFFKHPETELYEMYMEARKNPSKYSGEASSSNHLR